MNNELLEILAKVHNDLLTISTSGQDSFTMVQCIQSLRNLILELQKEEEASKE